MTHVHRTSVTFRFSDDECLCLTLIFMPVSSLYSCSIITHTIIHPSLLDALLFVGHLQPLSTYVCVDSTIQKMGSSCFSASVCTYINEVLVNDGYLYSRVYGTCMYIYIFGVYVY